MLEIELQKYENRKSQHYLSDTVSTLDGTQSPNRWQWHHHDSHGKEGRIEFFFDVQCHQPAEIMESQGTGAQKRPMT
jgi:hypothetical protein